MNFHHPNPSIFSCRPGFPRSLITLPASTTPSLIPTFVGETWAEHQRSPRHDPERSEGHCQRMTDRGGQQRTEAEHAQRVTHHRFNRPADCPRLARTRSGPDRVHFPSGCHRHPRCVSQPPAGPGLHHLQPRPLVGPSPSSESRTGHALDPRPGRWRQAEAGSLPG